VALPLLIVLCLTSVDFGRFAYAQIALGNAARVGAEVGATRDYSPSNAAAFSAEIEDAVREEFAAVGGLDPARLDVDVDAAPDAYDLYRVTVSATYSFVTICTWPEIPRPLDMHASVVFRRFR